MVELVDTHALEACALRACGFESHYPYNYGLVAKRLTQHAKNVYPSGLRVQLPPRLPHGDVGKLVKSVGSKPMANVRYD